mmetsp:Transcript_2397/g.10158  ORF Transcript_2397/g.10158 Transcript_2397/m.10158 type:complete len:106 (+) Transcript_2397:3906-4223(+)
MHQKTEYFVCAKMAAAGAGHHQACIVVRSLQTVNPMPGTHSLLSKRNKVLSPIKLDEVCGPHLVFGADQLIACRFLLKRDRNRGGEGNHQALKALEITVTRCVNS